MEGSYNWAFTLFMQERYAEALEVLAPPMLTRKLPLARLLRARCLHRLGRRPEAIEECNALVSVLPDCADAHGVLALLLYEQGESAKAGLHLETALKHNSQQFEAMLMRARMLSDTRDQAAANAAFTALLDVHQRTSCSCRTLGS
jgi:tetratricopeptide (TPR) repeat protein